ncbi:MAG: hypothetical protein HC904_04760 [Blastochloris sp.]|nr:hypothetical protein [Blastochloris sp.]
MTPQTPPEPSPLKHLENSQASLGCASLLVLCLATGVVGFFTATWLYGVLPPGEYPVILFALPVVAVVAGTFLGLMKLLEGMQKRFSRKTPDSRGNPS